jgi:hypothetical protein
VAVYSPGSEEPRILFPGRHPVYVPTGHIVYEFEGSVYATGFVLMIDQVLASPYAQFSVSRSGTLAYIPGGATSFMERDLVWVGRDGSEEAISAQPGEYNYARISPDGRRAALDARGDNSDILIWNFGLETLSRLTAAESSQEYPLWSDDGASIFYMSDGDVYVKAASGAGSEQLVLENPGAGVTADPYFLTPDGALVFREQEAPETDDDIGMIALESGAELTWLLDSPFIERNAVLSPNGRWMAYQSDETGRFEVYVRPFPMVDDDLIQISTAGGMYPLWARDGRELFYMQPGFPNQMMVMTVETGDGFVPGRRTTLIDDWPYFTGGEGRNYDVSPDGQRFLAVRILPTDAEDAQLGALRVNVVVNWANELRERVPVD